MQIRNLLFSEKTGLTESASEQIRDVINDFFNDCTVTTPDIIFKNYWRGDDSIMTKVGKSLVTDYPLIVNDGFYKTSTFFVTSAKSIKLGDIIEQATKKKFVVCESYFKKYSFESYRQLSHIVLAMTFVKYDVTSLYKEHIIFTLLAVMFRLFKVYENGQWLVNTMDVARLLSEVMDMDTVQFDLIAKQYGFNYSHSDVRTRTLNVLNIKRKPTCAEDLTRCFKDGMTLTEKKEAIMKWWRCGERTARKYMQQFGLTDSKYVRSDYKELHEHIDEAIEAVDETADNIVEHIGEATDAIVEHIDRTADNIVEHIRTLSNFFR